MPLLYFIIHGIIQHVFSIWLVFNHVRVIYVVGHKYKHKYVVGQIEFIDFHCSIIAHCMNILQFIHFTADAHLSYFYFVTNNVAINMSFCAHVQTCDKSGVELLGCSVYV